MSDTGLIQAPKNVVMFKEPRLVPYRDAVRFLWGDAQSHFVPDIIYGRGERISALIYRLAPGELFRSSAAWRPLYDQDRYYYVVQGELAIQDPESGDVAVARAGEAVYWRGARYHFGYNFGREETLVLDWYAPPERAASVPEITASAVKRDLSYCRDGREDLLGRWPTAALEDLELRLREGRMVTLREQDALPFIHGEASPVLVRLYVSSAVLTAGTVTLPPAIMSEPESHAGDEVLYALDGCLHVYLPDSFDWFELQPLDCLFLPEGTRHSYRNNGAAPAKAAFCIAPKYR